MIWVTGVTISFMPNDFIDNLIASQRTNHSFVLMKLTIISRTSGLATKKKKYGKIDDEINTVPTPVHRPPASTKRV